MVTSTFPNGDLYLGPSLMVTSTFPNGDLYLS